MSIASICNTHTADIYHAVITAGSMGMQTRTYPTAAYSSVLGTLQPADGRTREEFSKQSMVITHTFYTPTVLALQTGDRVTISAKNFNVMAFGDAAGRGRMYFIHLQSKD